MPPGFHLPCRYLQADEIWSFCNAEARNVPVEHRDDPEWGDVWTWTAIDRETKLVPSWYVGDRSSRSAMILMDDLRSRLAGRVQLSTDGHSRTWRPSRVPSVTMWTTRRS